MRVDLTEIDNSLAVVTPARDHAAVLDFGRAMQTLSVEHRQILLLVGLEGLNYREAAVELDIPIGTVMSRLARARERLRQALSGDAAVASDAEVRQ
jgi:RNA polymerase sigma-70 factor (ECF subfamily)